MNLKEQLTYEACHLGELIAANASTTDIHKQRMKWQNAHREYWKAVRNARRELDNDKRKRPASVSDTYGIDPADLYEVDMTGEA